jgi:hypothetical protein
MKMKYQKTIFILPLLCLFLLSCQDSSIEPENQFVQIYFKYGFKNVLNTFENSYEKDLVLDGVIKVKFWFTAEEQNAILEKAIEDNYFSIPDTLQKDSTVVIIDPSPGEQILRIKYQSKDKTTIWKYPLNEDNSQVKDLMKLTSFIISIIESKPEYKRLPPPRGGYL